MSAMKKLRPQPARSRPLHTRDLTAVVGGTIIVHDPNSVGGGVPADNGVINSHN
jgi:uncharacterized protein GlcG (DUF336 family)